MDQRGINAAGTTPMQAEFRNLAAVESPAQLAAAVARLHRWGIYVLFDSGPPPDPEPYLRTPLYLEHVARTFEMLGDAPAAAAAEAKAAVGIEIALGPDPVGIAGEPSRPAYVPLARRQLQQLAPSFAWAEYYAALGPLPPAGQPGNASHFAVVERLLRTTGYGAWQSYLRWEWAHAAVLWLPEAFREEEFRYHQAATGARGHLPRRSELCEGLRDSFSVHDYISADIRAEDFFGDALRLREAQALHALW